jgi:glycosyltransferase involved in cell wall biosynthesis
MEKVLQIKQDFKNVDIQIKSPERKILPVEVNWNKSIEFAETKYVKLLCADDYLHSNAIEDQVNFLETNPQCGFVGGYRTIVDKNGSTIIKKSGGSFLRSQSDFSRVLRAFVLRGTNVIGEPSAVLFRTELIKSNLPWKIDFPYAMDAEMYLRILRSSDLRVGFIPSVICHFSVSPDSWSSKIRMNQSADFIKLIRFNLNFKRINALYLLWFAIIVRINRFARTIVYQRYN